MLTPEERALRARLAVHHSWASTENRAARTEPARKAFNDRFAREVDPEGKLPPEERAKRIESARKAYYLALSYKAVRARRKAREAADELAEVEVAMAEGAVI